MRTALFWDITQRRVVIVYRRVGTTYRSHLQGSLDSWPLKMGPIRYAETSVNNYHTTPRNIPEDCSSYQHRGGRLKSGTRDISLLQCVHTVSRSPFVGAGGETWSCPRVAKVKVCGDILPHPPTSSWSYASSEGSNLPLHFTFTNLVCVVLFLLYRLIYFSTIYEALFFWQAQSTVSKATVETYRKYL
jgi:hypothetical protein